MIRAFLKKVGLLSKSKSPDLRRNLQPRIIPRSEHGMSRKDISENALKVLYRLHKQGYSAYLVGGGVRDLLLGLHPKDFDVVTDAKPEEVAKVFRNCRLIGRRFRLAHVFFGYDIVEVATFRGMSDLPSDELSHSDIGMILRDNRYGTLQEDVWRRDFTVNALYYNIADFSIVDYVGGYEDIKAKKLRMIGDVRQRYREDPVRMLRAIRFASKLGLTLSSDLLTPLNELKELITHVSASRLFEEVLKLFHSGSGLKAYEYIVQQGLMPTLFPQTAQCLNENNFPTDNLLKIIFANTDARIQEDKSVTPSFIVAGLLWHPICAKTAENVHQGMHPYHAKMNAIEDLLSQQCKRVSIPKKITQGAREIWILQTRLAKRNVKSIHQIMTEPRFRAAFDFLELRAQAGENVSELAHWWKKYIEAEGQERKEMLKGLGGPKKKRRRPKKISKKENES